MMLNFTYYTEYLMAALTPPAMTKAHRCGRQDQMPHMMYSFSCLAVRSISSSG
jgi:hypothetical protein